ncbi:MAG: dihydroneopterin aldolase [Paramuribaculum sp.]|nr:dihydroneopterin aldolase [Paramuribaculum sp.]MDE6488206.1 dihydroneopterin aldolase [Paramuribaculum sp.]
MSDNGLDVTITLDRLRVRACHGVLEQERLIGNDYEVTVSLSYPQALLAAQEDSLESTVSYADVASVVKEEMARPSLLLENVAYRIRQALIGRFPDVKSGRVAVTKLLPPIPSAQLAGATVELSW